MMFSGALMKLRITCGFIALAAALAPGAAWAGDATLAEALFRDGKSLMAAHDYARACPKLAASYEQDPATGTLFALAICYEESGKLASAWTAYNEVIGRARQEGRADRVQAATERASALEPQLSKLTVRVPAEVAALPGFSVRRDAQALPQAAWDSAVPVDPGEHVIEATATGHAPFRQTVSVGASADQKIVEVPALGGDASTPQPAGAATSGVDFAAPAAAEPKAQVPWRTIGLIVGGVGIVGLGVGSAFGLHAKSLDKDSRSNGDCDASGCNATGLQRNKDARSAGNVSTVLFVAGGVLVATGVTLFIVGGNKKSEASASLAVSPLLPAGGGGVALHGGF